MNHYSKNVLFGSEIGNSKIIYHSSSKEIKSEVNLKDK